MTNVGSVEVNVRLGLQQLQADAKKAQADLAKVLDDVTVKVTTDGLKEATQQFNQFKKAAGGGLGDIVPKSTGASITELARTLNASFKEAKNFASGLGLSADTANKAIAQIQNLNSANATTVEKFRVLHRELGITKQQFLALEQTVTSITPKLRGVGSGTEIAQLAQNLASTYREAQNFARGIGLTASQTNAAIATINRLNATNATAAEKFRALKSELGVSKQQFKELDAAVASTDTKLKQAATGVNQFLMGIAQGVGQSVVTSFLGAIQRGLSSILGVIPASVKAFIALDDAVKQVGIFTASTGTQELEELRDEIGRLGKISSKTQADVGALAISLSRAGFTVDEQRKALEGIVRASEATGEELTAVGDIVGKTIRVFSLAADEAGAVGDALVSTANNTNTSVTGIGESLKYVGPAAAAANQPLEDMLVLIGLLGDQGIQGSQAGTNLADALERLKVASANGDTEFVNLVRGSKKATEAFDAIGTQVRNADGSMKSVLEILPVLKENMDNLAQTDKDILFKALFGVEGGRAIQALLNTTPDRLELVSQKIKEAEGTSKTAGEAMLTGLGGALELLSSGIDALATELGSTFAPAAESLVRAAVPVVNAIGTLVEGFNDLSPAIKLSLLGVTGYIAAVQAAGVAMAVWSATMKIELAQQVANTAATGANTIAKNLNTTVTVANTGALIGNAAAHVKATGATVAATVATRAFMATALKAALVVGALAAAIALIKFVDLTVGLRETNDEIDALSISSNAAADGALAATGRTKKAIEQVQQARKEGRSLTEDEKKAIEGLTQANDQRIATLDEELEKQKALKAELEQKDANTPDAAGLSDGIKAQINSVDALIGQTERSKQALSGQNELLKDSTTTLGDNADAAEEAASAIDTLSASYAKTGHEAKIAASEAKAALAESFAAGDINQEQFDQGVLDAEEDFLNQRLEQNRAFLVQLKDLQATTQDSEELEKIGQQILQVEEAIAGDRLAIAQQSADARVAAEEEAAQKILDALDQKSADAQTSSDVSVGGLDLTSQRLSEQQSLLSAQNDLLSAQFAIREQALQTAIDEAEANENSVESTRLKNQLEQERGAFIDQQFAIQRQQLELTQEQRAIDLERQKILSDLSIIEAEIAIEKARAEGASAAEIANLTRVLELRQKERDAVDSAIANQEKINTLEDQTLTANQELEHLKNQQVEAREGENNALDEQKKKLEEIQGLEKELQDIRASTQNTKNKAAVDAAQAEYDANPTQRNLNALQDAREKAIEDEFNARQEALDAESKAKIAAAEVEAKAAAEAYNAAQAGLSSEADAAWSDGTLTDEEEERLELLQEQNDKAKEQVDSASKQLDLEKQIADAKQTQLDTEREAAQAAEEAKQEAEGGGKGGGFRDGDANASLQAQSKFEALFRNLSGDKGVGKQYQAFFKFAQQDIKSFNRVGGNKDLDFADLQLSRLGGTIASTALQLEKIADGGKSSLANDLAKQLDAAQKNNDTASLDALLQEVSRLAAAASSPKTINITGAGIGESAQVLREMQRAESGARY